MAPEDRGCQAETALAALVRAAIDGLAEANVCVHGPAFDSEEYGPDWVDWCSVCRALRPLVLAVKEPDR